MSKRPSDRVIPHTRSQGNSEHIQPRGLRAAVGRVAQVTGTAPPVLRYAGTTLALALTTAALWPLRDTAGLLNLGLVYLVVVIGVTAFAGRRAGIFASVLGFALLDYFMVPPHLTFAIEGIHNILALAVFLGVSLLISWLLANAREQARQARMRAEDLSRLYDLNQAVIGARHPEDILPAVAQRVRAVFGAQACWILMPGASSQAGLSAIPGQISVVAQSPSDERPLTRDEMSLASWAYEHAGEVAGGGKESSAPSAPGRGGQAIFVPLRAADKTTGVLAVARARPFTRAERTVLATFAGQTAAALERLRLLGEAERAEALARTDELKSALVSAVSHDLRTPLASIMASVTSLLDPEVDWDQETRHDFLQGIYDQAQRLNILVGNLLNMSRIEGGALHPEKNWYSIEEVIDVVLQRLDTGPSHPGVVVKIEGDLPLVLLDFTEIAQVLTNLLENAFKYAPASAAVSIVGRKVNDYVQISVLDDGPGVPAQALPRIFDKFYRVEKGKTTGGIAGTGLGLAIAKGFVQAHGGTIWARNRPEGGLEVSFTLPLEQPGVQSGTPAAGGKRSKVGV